MLRDWKSERDNRCGEDWNRVDRSRIATPWRVWKLIRQELAIAIGGVLTWNLTCGQACVEVMKERPRRWQLPNFAASGQSAYAYCQANGFSNT
jgi:hypothetical protein